MDSQRMCLLLEALLAIAPLVAECAALQSPACSLASHLIAQAKPSAVKVRHTTTIVILAAQLISQYVFPLYPIPSDDLWVGQIYYLTCS